MTQAFTPNFVQNLQSNLYIKIRQEPKLINGDRYGDYYFQVLIFENEDTPKLVYGTKNVLQRKYDLDSSSFPSSGCDVDKDFCPPCNKNNNNVARKDQNEDPLAQAELSTVRFLLQTRKISQMIAYTWLEPDRIPDEKKTKVNLVRKILRFPSKKMDIHWLDDLSQEPELIKEIDLYRKLLGDEEKVPTEFSWLIKPEHTSYDFISLALLLCGQAFYKDENENFTRVWEPIGSIYQLIFEYAVDVSWELFHGVMTEIARTGQDFPANKITVPYPPRPSEFNVSQIEIENWSKADDYNSLYPFYPTKYSEVDPTKYSEDWKNCQVKTVYPPSPYIPLSSF